MLDNSPALAHPWAVTKVSYLTSRVCLVSLLLAGSPLAGCLAGAGRAEVVSAFSGNQEGPRSYKALTQEIAAQSDDVRALFLQAQGLYPYLQNSYRVRLRINDDGEVVSVDLLDRQYVIHDFERAFLERVRRFKFSEYDGPDVEVVYTFSFYPERIMPPKPVPGGAPPPAAETPAGASGPEKAPPTPAAEAAAPDREPAAPMPVETPPGPAGSEPPPASPATATPAQPAAVSGESQSAAGAAAIAPAEENPEKTPEETRPQPAETPAAEASEEAPAGPAPADEPFTPTEPPVLDEPVPADGIPAPESPPENP